MNHPPRMSTRRRFALTVFAAAAFLGSLSFVVWRLRPLNTRDSALPTPDLAFTDPRLTYPTPYRNVRPDVHYVGDRTCTECHGDIAETYRRHPMGRSLAPVALATPVERYDQAAGNPFEKEGFQFWIERQGDHVCHRELHRDVQGRSLPVQAVEVHFAIGSGTRGRSYLIEREGYVFQSLLSWYSQPGVWDFTPGVQLREQFERPAEPSCLFCHANQVEPVAGAINRYRVPVFRGHAIGCERCHGPGELHVNSHSSGEARDNSIVDPGRLAPVLRDAVCQQCHLQG